MLKLELTHKKEKDSSNLYYTILASHRNGEHRRSSASRHR